MKLEHSFTVPAPVDRAWATLLDIEGVAPCMPGATLTGVDGDEFTGTVKVKLGPVALTYSGKGSFRERDDEAHTVLIDATGRDRNGNGTAGAAVHARMEPAGPDSTRVVVETDLKITGRPAQFGRGVMQDVGGKIIGQFADRLAAKMAAAPAEDAANGTSDGGADSTAGGATGDAAGGAAAVAGAGGSDDLAATRSDADRAAAPAVGTAALGTAPGAEAGAEAAQALAATTGSLPVTNTDDASGGASSGGASSGGASSGGAAGSTHGSSASSPSAVPTGVPTLAAATAPTGGPRPAAPRPEPVRPLTAGAGGTSPADEPAAELDLGAAVLPVLLRRFAPPVLIALVAAFVAWRLVRRRG